MNDPADTAHEVVDEGEGSSEGSSIDYNPLPQNAPGAGAAKGHNVGNSIPLSIFPIAMDKFCICLVGLPGRGKTHIAHRLSRYLEFFHAIPTKLFNFSEHRRNMHGRVDNYWFFDQTNEKARNLREETYNKIYGECQEFLTSNPTSCTILDSTNATLERRQKVMEVIRPTGAKVLWIEVNNDDDENLAEAYQKIVTDSPDYEGVSAEEAAEDLQKRIQLYNTLYEPLGTGKCREIEKRYSYIKCNLVDRTFTIHNVRGYLEQKIVHLVMNLRAEPHDFYLTRHGQSEYNAVGRIGGDSGLSKHGQKYAQVLGEWVEEHITRTTPDGAPVPARLWTSTMRRTKETTRHIKTYNFSREDEHDPSLQHEWVQMKPRAWHHLDELFAGSCDGMTYEEIEKAYPEEFARRSKDKLVYRYPRGESYLDVIARLEPMVIEMERHREPLMIVGHQGILRIIYAFYMGLSRAEAPFLSIPLHTVVHLRPTAFTCHVVKSNLYRIELSNDGQDEPNKPGKVSGSLNAAAQAVVSAVKAVSSLVTSGGTSSSSSSSSSSMTSAATPGSTTSSSHGASDGQEGQVDSATDAAGCRSRGSNSGSVSGSQVSTPNSSGKASSNAGGSSTDAKQRSTTLPTLIITEETKDFNSPTIGSTSNSNSVSPIASGNRSRSMSMDEILRKREQDEKDRMRTAMEDAINDPQSH